ncbi:MAG: phosphate uptake regulator PhoU [Thermoproteota archaeon]|jgi:phosphate uptake regulator|nr:phosphate uptake regulator PhoU [Thermoproteota archaeon]
MLRKLQKIGNTYYVAIPTKWVEENKLKKGEEILLTIRHDGNILIYSNKLPEEKTVNIKFDKYIDRRILSYYLLGYHTINVISDQKFTEEERQKILNTAKNLIGLEIVEETMNSITLHNLINDASINPIKLLLRLNAITSTMYVEIIKGFYEEDETLIKQVIDRDNEVDRLYFLMVRQIRSLLQNETILNKLNLTYTDCLDLRIAGLILEKIGDESVKIAEYLLNNKIGKGTLQTLKKITEEIQEIQERAIIRFLNKKSVEEIKERINFLFYRLNSIKDIPSEFLFSLKNILNLIIDICDLTIYY